MPKVGKILEVVPEKRFFIDLRSTPAELDDNKLAKLLKFQKVKFVEGDEEDDWWKVQPISPANADPGFLMRKHLKAFAPTPPPPLDEEVFVERVARYSPKAGSNGTWLIAVAAAETGIKDVTDQATGRVGPFNFRPDTWNALIEELPENRLGQESIASWSRQIVMAARSFSFYREELAKALGEPATAWQLYLAHIVGDEAAIALLKASPDSTLVDKALDGAGFGRDAIDRVLTNLSGAKDGNGDPSTLKAMYAEVTSKLQDGIDKAHEILGIEELGEELGKLSRQYETGSAGGDPGAIGFDRTGGPSYGTYQLAARQGTVKRFIDFLASESHLGHFAQALVDAGGDKEARKKDSKPFGSTWKELALDPEFAAAQHAFIKTRFYDKCAKKLGTDGVIDVAPRSKTLKDVVWSVAVQHGVGGGVKLFKNAKGNKAWNKDIDVINDLYTERKKVHIYFKRSTPAVQASVKKRFNNEHNDALADLRAEEARALIPSPGGIGGVRGKVVKIARDELTDFARKPKGDPNGTVVQEKHNPLKSRVMKYFSLVPGNQASPSGVPWSAAFISFVMREANATQAQFPFSAAHAAYIKQALKNRQDGKLNASIVYFDLGEPGARFEDLRVGDLIGFSSEATSRAAIAQRLRSGAHFSSHTDFITSVDVAGRTITTIGGNRTIPGVRDESIMEKRARMKANGSFKSPKYFFILRINV